MSPLPLWIREIEHQSRGLPVLLVEGLQDVTIFEHFFNQRSPGWDLRLYIAPAGGKRHVHTGVCTHRPDWIGIMDLDEWSDEDVQEAAQGSDRLKALPRFCIESYFCHPNELWPAIPPSQRDQLGGGLDELARPIYDALPDWVMHGALWRVLRRLYRETNLPVELERGPVTNEDKISQILTDWYQNLAPDRVLAQYHQELNVAQSLSREEQIRKYVHGKKFFNQVVVQTLNELLHGGGADDWLDRFRDEKIQPPPDLQPLLDWVLSLVS